MTHFTILGGGLAGLAAAQRAEQLGHAANLYEKNNYLGGHAYSHTIDGFTFDEGPHVSFTKDPVIQKLFEDAVQGEYSEHDFTLLNDWKGHHIKHPVQCHLYGLPDELVSRCVNEMKASDPTDESITYAEWCHNAFGPTFSQEFIFKYTQKYWTASADKLTTDWVNERVYIPSQNEIKQGAAQHNPNNFHYIKSCRYPKQGGFSAYIKAVSSDQDVNINHEISEIDLENKKITFSHGNSAHFETLISSLPLPILIKTIKDAPLEIKRAAEKLSCTSMVLINIGLERSEDFPPAHMMYFYDEDIIFSRAHFPHTLSSNNTPGNCGSIQLEIYHSAYRPLDTQDVLSRAMNDLFKTKLINKHDKILFSKVQHVPFANVIFDHDRQSNLGLIREYLAQHQLHTCGRYGDWAYYWSDDSIKSGWQTVEKCLKDS